MVNPLKNRPTFPPARSSSSDLSALRDDREPESPHVQPVRKASRHSAISMIGGAGLWLGVAGACASDSWADDLPARKSSATAAATPAPPAADSLKSLDARIQGLASRLKTLQDRLATMGKSAPSAELGALQSRIDKLAKSTETVASLAKSVGALDRRVGAVDKQVADLREQVVALKARMEKAAATERPHRAAATSEGDFSKAVETFKAARYKEASALFRTLTKSQPDDARVWYYAGLSHGLATNNWADETLRLVYKGVEREKAGTPDKAKIDASLAGVSQKDVKNWLDSYRKTARR
jgi:chaperonin cofactor prefoldin